MERQELKNLIRKYHHFNTYELQKVTSNVNSDLSEQIMNLEIQNVRLDIFCDEIEKFFKQKGYKKVSFMVEPKCFAVVLKDKMLKTITYPIFDFSAVDNKKVKTKKDFHKANIDFIRLISNYRLTGFSFFLKRFPECEDVMLNALRLTNQAKYKKALDGLVNEKINVGKILTQSQPESIINKMIKREKYLVQKIDNVKSLINTDENDIEISTL